MKNESKNLLKNQIYFENPYDLKFDFWNKIILYNQYQQGRYKALKYIY